MNTINDLSVTSTVSSDDKLPIWQNANGVTRGLPISVLDARYLTAADVAALAASPTTERFISDILPNPTGLPTFTAGVTAALTLANQYFSNQNIEVFFDTGYQGIEQRSLIGFGLAFTSVIPVGVQNVYVYGGATRVVGTPSDGTVTDAMIAAGSDIFNRINDEFSVMDFGADPTGATDSTTAFNNAAATNKAIYVPGGTWNLNNSFTPGTAAWNISPRAMFTGVFPNFKRGFWTDVNVAPFGNGANIWRFNDRVFVGTAAMNDGKQNPVSSDWTGSMFAVGGVSAFGYLESNSTFSVGSRIGQPAIVAATRSSDSGAAGNAAIGISSVVVNDNTIGVGASGWCYYATTVRGVGSTGGSTLGMEIDVTNLANEVDLYPSAMFGNGLSANLWLGAGGELPYQVGNTYTFNKVSAAIGIFANQPGPFTNCVFEKGIVFGAGGISSQVAIALPVNYSMTWFNTGNSVTSVIFSSATFGDAPHAQKIQFSDSGTLITDGSGNPQFRVVNGISNAANYVATSAAPTTGTPVIQSFGTDANVNLGIQAQGTGQIVLGSLINNLKFAAATSGSSPAAGGAGALPATPKGYATVNINGTSQQVAYY